MSDKLINIWSRIKIYCLNHEEPVEMQIVQNLEKIKTPFYACPFYCEDPTNGKTCPNRLNLDDYHGMVMKFIEIMNSEGLFTDMTNYQFVYKGTKQKIKVKVLSQTDKEIRLGILNLTVFGKKE